MATVIRSAMLYWTTFAIAATVSAVVAVFFVIGIADGSVSSFNIALWLGLLATVGVVLFAGHALRARQHTGLAVAVLCVLAVPGLVYGLFILLIVLTNPRWN